ncbi:hypothetical protein BLIJ_1601 [Bifidobacterium longum subsp. infantis ATCC 15697 = JCM 1222 = DSM 20088]|nr:hypothetical protein BLIJ_1601 [Bifidobacterium longum subsp. infantis ATCC 15697 = JCM 1222 = DSM 20088]
MLVVVVPVCACTYALLPECEGDVVVVLYGCPDCLVSLSVYPSV